MTYERKITVGLDDIKTIVFECKKCKSRLSLSPDSVGDIPFQCPRLECKHPWRFADAGFSDSVRSPFSNFVSGLAGVRKLIAQEQKEPGVGFTIILEFDEAEMTKQNRLQ